MDFSRRDWYARSMLVLGMFLGILFAGFFPSVSAQGSYLRADANCDGRVDLDDYSILISEFGKSGNKNAGCGVASGQATPTPTPTPTPSGPTPTPSPTPTPKPPSVNLNDADLIAYYPMEEASGSLVNQKPGKTALNLIPQGTPTYGQAGKVGKAVKLKSADYFCTGSGTTCADANDYDFTGSFTIGMWVNFDEMAWMQFLFRKWDQGEGSYTFSFTDKTFLAALSHPHPDWLFGYDQGALKNLPHGRSWRSAVTTVTPKTWNHLVVVRDTSKSTYDLYVNGAFVATTVGVTTQSNGSQVTSVMRNDNQASKDPFRVAEFLAGSIDDLFAYKRALNANEVKAIYDATK